MRTQRMINRLINNIKKHIDIETEAKVCRIWRISSTEINAGAVQMKAGMKIGIKTGLEIALDIAKREENAENIRRALEKLID